MAERASLVQLTQLGMEATAGTTVAATRQMQSMSWTPSIMTLINMFRPQGQKYNTFSALAKEWSGWKVAGDPTFGEIVYLLSGIAGKQTPALMTPPSGGAGAYKWTYTPSSVAIDNVQTFTVEQGDAVRAEQAGLVQLTGLDFKATRESLTLTADAIGQAITDGFSMTVISGTSEVITATITGTPTGGTVAWGFRGQTTAGVAYNATASVLQTALTGLSTIGVGNVTVTGGPGPGTPWVITFSGSLANQPIGTQLTAAASLTGGASPAIGLVRTTPGVAITPEVPAQPIIPTQIALYIDSSAGALGTTVQNRAFTYEFSLSGKADAFWPFQTSSTSFPGVIELAPKTGVKFLLEANAQGMGELTNMRAGSTQFVRLQATGPTIDGTNTFLLQIDAAVKIKQPSEYKDESGIYAIEWDCELVTDPGWGKAWAATVQNMLPAL